MKAHLPFFAIEIKNPRVRICVEHSFEFFVVKRKRKCKSLMAQNIEIRRNLKMANLNRSNFAKKVAVENQFYK